MAPHGLREIGQEAFYSCRSLERAVLNERLEKLGEETNSQVQSCYGVFEASGVAEVRLPASLRVLGPAAFRNCRNLYAISLPERLQRVCAECFGGSGLERVSLPEEVQVVEDSAFYGCRHLKSATFAGSALEEGGRGAFARTGLGPEAVRFPASAAAEGAFAASEGSSSDSSSAE